eukprot:23025_1
MQPLLPLERQKAQDGKQVKTGVHVKSKIKPVDKIGALGELKRQKAELAKKSKFQSTKKTISSIYHPYQSRINKKKTEIVVIPSKVGQARASDFADYYELGYDDYHGLGSNYYSQSSNLYGPYPRYNGYIAAPNDKNSVISSELILGVSLFAIVVAIGCLLCFCIWFSMGYFAASFKQERDGQKNKYHRIDESEQV